MTPEELDKRRAACRAYHAAHREEICARKRATYQAYYLAHRDEIAAKSHARRRLQTEAERLASLRSAREATRRWRKKHTKDLQAKRMTPEHRQRATARMAAWRKQNPERDHASKAQQRARKAHAPVNDLTAAQWREILEHYGRKCVYCGRRMKRLTQDHIIPLVKGGAHTASNIVPACGHCNSSKHAGPPLVPVQPLLFTVATPRKRKRRAE